MQKSIRQLADKIQNLLRKYNIRPIKKLGQNFLIDENVLKKILEAAELSPEDTVLEIGPGLGILTIELAKQAKKVITVEKDKKMCEILENMLDARNVRNVQIVNDDILNTKYKLPNTKYKIVANLPYYITSPVIRRFLEAKNKPELMILMVQKEVAQRIVAKPPHMNLLAIAIQFYAHPVRNFISNGAGPKIISYISKKSFWPQPKVDSAIIKITPTSKKSEMLFLRLQGEVINLKNNRGVVGSPPCHGAKITSRISSAESLFFSIVKAGFSSKRKMLKNNLKIKEFTLKKLGLNPKIRAENLSIDDWVKLYYEIYSPH